MKKYLILFVALPLFAQPIEGPTLGPAPGTSGVATINGLGANVTITNGLNVTIVNNTNTHVITISSSGSGSTLWTALTGAICPSGATGTNGGWIATSGVLYPE